MSRALDGKVAVVLGAGACGPGWSNGNTSAVAYARAGASVLAVDYLHDRAEETVRIISSEGNLGRPFRADATCEQDVEAAMAYAVSAFGGIDIVHNNVGMGGAGGSAHETELSVWNHELAVSLTSTFLGVRTAIPHLRARGGGAIVNISSIAAVRFMKRGRVAYSVAKAGVETLTRVCAADYGPDNIRVNCIRIGFSDTPQAHQAYEAIGIRGEALTALLAQTAERVPLRHERTQPWGIASVAVFLASEAARDITGVVLGVDGGLEVATL
jgi:NAD(P)-dependent dehydrogenase (short-subunit alcohol dehydrogenase family)